MGDVSQASQERLFQFISAFITRFFVVVVLEYIEKCFCQHGTAGQEPAAIARFVENRKCVCFFSVFVELISPVTRSEANVS